MRGAGGGGTTPPSASAAPAAAGGETPAPAPAVAPAVLPADALVRGMDTVVAYSAALDTMCGSLVHAASPLLFVQSAAARGDAGSGALPAAVSRALAGLQAHASRLRAQLSQLSLAAATAAGSAARRGAGGGAGAEAAGDAAAAVFIGAAQHAAACASACELAGSSGEVISALLAAPVVTAAQLSQPGGAATQRTVLDELRSPGGGVSGSGGGGARPASAGAGAMPVASSADRDRVVALEGLLEARTRLVKDWETFASELAEGQLSPRAVAREEGR